ncbi:MAG: bicarbonate transport system permease protein CmpB [Candidatus Parcubacteria bacterium]|jgi:NitT/TauT family transport system permease protein
MRYPVTTRERLWALVLGPLLVCILIYVVALLLPAVPRGETVSFGEIMGAMFMSFVRVFVAYALAVAAAIPLALLVEVNPTVESLLLPVFDVLESVPNLAVLPILVIFFLQFGFLDGAAIAILFLGMVWNLVFALVGGLKVIPRDVAWAAKLFGLAGYDYVKKFTLPAIFPQFVTGSILAVASGWNIIIVAEALHVYVPGGKIGQDLFGIGSVLVQTSAAGHTGAYMAAFGVLIGSIAFLNLFVWQKLLHYAQRFRFD